MKDFKADDLITEIVTDEKLTAFRHETLNYGLTLMARRRRVARVRQFAVLALAPLILTVCVLKWQPESSRPPHPMAASPSRRESIPAQKVHIIGDEELFALFPGKTVALIGPRGKQELVIFPRERVEKE